MSITSADARVSKKILDAKKPIDRVQSLAETIIYSMAEDAPVAAPSTSATPGVATPQNPALARVQNGMKRSSSSDSLAAAGQRSEADTRVMAGCKALDHLSRLLTSCETVSAVLVALTSSFTPAILVTGRRSLRHSCRIWRTTLWSAGLQSKSRRARRQRRGGLRPRSGASLSCASARSPSRPSSTRWVRYRCR
jgi:proteasome activator subunit 4